MGRIKSGRYNFLLYLSFLAFISLGLPDGLLGIAWPSMSGSFGQALSRLALLQVAMTSGFFLSSTNTARLIRRLGVGRLLVLSNTLVATALLLYVLAEHWYLVVFASVLLGTGGGAVDAGLNTYSAEHFSKEQLTLLHAFYGFGAMLGPAIMRFILIREMPWQRAYFFTFLLIFGLLIIFFLFRRSWDDPGRRWDEADPLESRAAPAAPGAEGPSVFSRRGVGIPLFFFYTGFEVTVGAWSFSLLSVGRGFDPGITALWVGGYWTALTGGRIFFGFVGRRWSSTGIIAAMQLLLSFGSLLLLQPWWSIGAFIALPIIGFSCAPLFPLFVTLTPHVVGKESAGRFIGLQVAAASIGAAAVPALVGLLVEFSSLEAVVMVLLALSLLIIAIYRHWLQAASRID
ncbi:MAG TPA: MFS transporter [Sediminispirochaeta sp.]|nr:MFS transporter [Sediminispirochaeta sp.]